MDLDQKLARDEAKIKAQKHAVMRYCFFLGGHVWQMMNLCLFLNTSYT